MPLKSESQRRFMQMSKSPEGRKRLKAYGSNPAPKKVAEEFLSYGKTAAKKVLGTKSKNPYPNVAGAGSAIKSRRKLLESIE